MSENENGIVLAGNSSDAEEAPAVEAPSSPRDEMDVTNDEEAASSASLPRKRPSPWRQPREVREANAAAASPDWSPRGVSPKKTAAEESGNAKKAKSGISRKIFQDVISVRIPLHVTADLGVAIQRTRTKRIEALQKAFPKLKPPEKPENKLDAAVEDDKNKGETTAEKGEEDGDAKGGNSKKKQPKKMKHVPQPQDYANVLDYLEAKYVQGVMIDDGEEEGEEDDEGQGSVYSEANSFLDDTDLKRTVAEQVLSHTTTTKLELQDDEEFFVNVGNLEVEETELTQHEYDPLEDTKTKSPSKRKRKKPASIPTKEKAGNGKIATSSKTTATASKITSSSSPQKKKAKTTVKQEEKENEPDSKKKAKPVTGVSSDALAPLEKKAQTRKLKYEKLYKTVVEMINSSSNEELPRRITKLKCAITCPPDKKPGDVVLFANPHVSKPSKDAAPWKTCSFVENHQSLDHFCTNLSLQSAYFFISNRYQGRSSKLRFRRQRNQVLCSKLRYPSQTRTKTTTMTQITTS
jgi:hypothetical protein